MYVDNTAPEIAVVSPDDKMTVNGEFVIAGRAYDAVGIKTLEWEYGKEKGEIELIPGNPYFIKKLDIGNASGKVSVTFRVTDIAGNVRNTTITRNVDATRDLPQLTVFTPIAGVKLSDSLFVSGSARDDDGVSKIVWQIDKGAESEVPTDGAFVFSVADVAFGPHTLTVWAVDTKGKRGNPVTRAFTWFGATPLISITGASDSNGQQNFVEGMQLSTIDGKASLSGVIKAANQLVKVQYSINGGAPLSLTAGKTPGDAQFTIPLPASLPFGVLTVEIQATDAADKTAILRVPVYAINYARARVGPLVDFANVDKSDVIEITQAKPLFGAFVAPYPDEQIASVRLEPASAVVRVSYEKSLIRVEYGAEGATKPTKVIVTTSKNRTVEAGPYVFRTGAVPPGVALSKPVFGSWHKGPVDIAGAVTDGSTLAGAEVSVNGGTWQSAVIKGKEFSYTLPSAGLEGPVLISVRVLSATGGVSVQQTAVMVDTAEPKLKVLAPIPGSVTADRAGGDMTFVCALEEPLWSVSSVEVVRGTAVEKLVPAQVVSFTANPSKTAVTLRVTDKAGNVAAINVAEGLKTVNAPYVPENPQAVKTNLTADDFQPAIMVSGTDVMGAISWSGPFFAVEEKNYPKELDRVIRVTGASTLNIKVRGILLNPKKPEIFYGFSRDSVTQTVALKAGKTAGEFEGTIKLAAQADGRITLWFRSVNQDGVETYTRCEMEYDSTAPQVTLLSPGSSAANSFALAVQADDLFGIAKLSYKIEIGRASCRERV